MTGTLLGLILGLDEAAIGKSFEGHTLKTDLGPKRDTEASAAISGEKKNKNNNKEKRKGFF